MSESLGATQDVFELVLARPVVTEAGEHSSLAHLWWSAPLQGDRLAQVYVDGQLTDVTAHPRQRQMMLVCDRTRAHRIELLAVLAEEAWRDRPELLASWVPPLRDRVSVSLVRDERLPVDTQISVSLDGQVIDQQPLWSGRDHRAGFGALFGIGAFGRDGATAPGIGLGELGLGPLGIDGAAWRWAGANLPSGVHDLAFSAHDLDGTPVAEAVEINDVVIGELPPAAGSLSITPAGTLQWT